jgi:hypothetical protein
MPRKRLKRGTSVTLARLKEGERGLRRDPNKPILALMAAGRRSYLWIGNDAPGDMACFATVDGEATLRRIATMILAALPAARRSKPGPPSTHSLDGPEHTDVRERT